MKKEWSAGEIESLVHLSSLINSSLDIGEVLDTSMRVVEELMDAERSSIFEIDPERNELFFRLIRGADKGTVRKVRMKMGEGIAGWVADTGEPVVVPDTEKDERFSKKIQDLTNIRIRSIIAVPIRNRGRISGVIEVLNMRGPFPADGSHVKALTIVANQIGTAVENAVLYERLKEKFVLTRNELKKTQAALIHSERMAALGELSKGVAHVIRNPVMSIGGFTRRLKKKLSGDGSAAGYIDVILEETSRLEKIVRDVGKHTCMREPSCCQAKMSVLVQSAMKRWEERCGVDNILIETSLMPEDPEVSMDVPLLAEAVDHLLNNAAEAMPDGGTVVLSAWKEAAGAVISISDAGTGIDPEDMPLVFDPFFTTKTHGSGLGLTTVKRIVEGHGGEVKIVCGNAGGTDVRIYIPLESGRTPL